MEVGSTQPPTHSFIWDSIHAHRAPRSLLPLVSLFRMMELQGIRRISLAPFLDQFWGRCKDLNLTTYSSLFDIRLIPLSIVHVSFISFNRNNSSPIVLIICLSVYLRHRLSILSISFILSHQKLHKLQKSCTCCSRAAQVAEVLHKLLKCCTSCSSAAHVAEVLHTLQKWDIFGISLPKMNMSYLEISLLQKHIKLIVS